MHTTSSFLVTILLTVTLSSALGQEYRLELVNEAAEADEVSTELAQLLSEKCYRVKRGSNRTVCEIWFCKQWETDGEFQPTDERLYPFEPGQLIGLVHFRRKGSDFRDQRLDSGWYTLRSDLQPIDGNHEGTSPTRDFLLLVSVANDQPAKKWDVEQLHQTSALAAGSSHPAMLCLQPATADPQPSIRHDETKDWWILHLAGKGRANGEIRDIYLDVVVAGQADE